MFIVIDIWMIFKNFLLFFSSFSLPGRALANDQPIWLYNAHSADSKVFSRSLLAKVVVFLLVLLVSWMNCLRKYIMRKLIYFLFFYFFGLLDFLRVRRSRYLKLDLSQLYFYILQKQKDVAKLIMQFLFSILVLSDSDMLSVSRGCHRTRHVRSGTSFFIFWSRKDPTSIY